MMAMEGGQEDDGGWRKQTLPLYHSQLRAIYFFGDAAVSLATKGREDLWPGGVGGGGR